MAALRASVPPTGRRTIKLNCATNFEIVFELNMCVNIFFLFKLDVEGIATIFKIWHSTKCLKMLQDGCLIIQGCFSSAFLDYCLTKLESGNSDRYWMSSANVMYAATKKLKEIKLKKNIFKAAPYRPH